MKQERRSGFSGLLAIASEIRALAGGSTRLWLKLLPSRLTHELVRMGSATDQTVAERFGSAVGDVILAYLEDLGPIYGKGAQILLSRIDNGESRLIDLLDLSRIYGDWPAVARREIDAVLDAEVPNLRNCLTLEDKPIGVASVGQVYGAIDAEGKEWVVKVVKPGARIRLMRTLEAAEAAVQSISKLPGVASSAAVRELNELIAGLRGEVNLRREADTIEKLRAKLDGRRSMSLKIPAVWPDLCSESVVVIERFRGTPLSKIISGERKLNESERRKLATRALHELLVQVFEVGIFHADPHAGNLMLLDDGRIGIYDWGLAGELTEQDRKHIAELLKAVIARDMTRLAQALVDMAAQSGQTIDLSDVEKELKGLAKALQREKTEAAKKLSLQKLISSALSSAEKLKIPVPNGLLMMSKALVTIEGLSRGIDPRISMARIAAPILLRASRPGFRDFFNLAKSAMAFRSMTK
jgi:ubiquinone biosynthesis protein